MNLFSELKKAVLENIAASSTTPAATGRIYADVTTSTAAIPRFYNGSAWVQLLTGSSNSVVTQNSGKGVTVDWSTGLLQQVKLTDSAVISFINPQPGQTHTLIVTSSPLVSGAYKIYGYKFNMTDQDSRRQPYQPLGMLPNQGSQVYSWLYSASIKPGYATVPAVSFPPTAPGTASTGIDITADGKFLLVGQSSTPYTQGYNLFDTSILAQATAGYKDIVASTAAAATATGVAYSMDGRAAFVSSGTSPYIQGFYVDRGKPTSTAFSNPGTLPTGAANCVAMHPNNLFVGVGHATTPFMSIYPFNGQGFGTKVTNPGTLPDAAVLSLAWAPTGDYLAGVSATSPYLRVWAFDQNAGTFGAVASNPATLPQGAPSASNLGGILIAWRPQTDYIALAIATTPYLYIVPFNRSTGAFGTALTISALAGTAQGVAWTPDGQYLIVSTSTTPTLYVYDFSSGAPVNVTFDAGSTILSTTGIVVAPNGEYFYAALSVSPYLTQFSLPQKTRNYLRLNY